MCSTFDFKTLALDLSTLSTIPHRSKNKSTIKILVKHKFFIFREENDKKKLITFKITSIHF